MANKMKMLTLLQEARGYAQLSYRHPAPRPNVLFLMKLRAQAARPAAPRRRLAISVTSGGGVNVPLPVKITHLKQENFAPQLRAA